MTILTKERVRNSLTWERRRPACASGYIKMGKLFKTREHQTLRELIMAHVSNVRLSMGRVSASLEFAEVTFSINFSGKEVADNLAFGLFIPLFEIDDELDTYHWEPNGAFNVGVNWRALGDLDDFVTWIASEVIRPNGSSTVVLTRRKEFDVGNQEAGNEEYKALVWVIPEIVEGKAWSNTLSINLG